MIEKACVYILNDNQIYHGMFSVSLRMLRRKNPDIPVVLFYVRDANADSWHKNTLAIGAAFDKQLVSDHMLFGERAILDLCRRESVRVEMVDKLPYATQNFVSIQRCVFDRCGVGEALLLDVDTFVFGDVGQLFGRSPSCEVLASPMVGVFGNQGVTTQNIIFSYMVGGGVVKRLVKPANSGVVLFRRNLIREYGSVVKQYCDLLMCKKHPMSHMMYTMRPDGRSREEFSFNLYLLESGKNFCFFENSDVSTYDHSPGSVVFHSSSASYPSNFSIFCRAGNLVPN